MLTKSKYNNHELDNIRYASKIVGYCHYKLRDFLKVGVTSTEINNYVNDIIVAKGGISGFKGYQEFPDYVCIAINDCILHGVNDNVSLKDGDIISIDIGVKYQGYYGDSAWTYKIGSITKEEEQLLLATEQGLDLSIKEAIVGNLVSNISKVIQKVSQLESLAVIPDFTGHGVGINLHEDPYIFNVYVKEQQDRLQLDSVIAIEPIFKLGDRRYYIDPNDKWSVYSVDKMKSAHYEHTVHVSGEGPIILTIQEDWID